MLRVLVVDDEPLLCDLVADALRDHGFNVHAAANVDEAIAHLCSGTGCDVMFTDINLGRGGNGVTLSWRARGLRPGLPVVYASGSVGGLQELRAVPGARFVPKPYDLDRLASTLREMTRELMPA